MVNRGVAAVPVLGVLLLLSVGPLDATPGQGLDDLLWATVVVFVVGYWTVYLRWAQRV